MQPHEGLQAVEGCHRATAETRTGAYKDDYAAKMLGELLANKQAGFVRALREVHRISEVKLAARRELSSAWL